MIDVLRGLEHAHSKGILHRDIKPANILIGEYMQGKLSDFGLAVSKSWLTKSVGVKDYAYIFHLAPEINNITDYSVLSDIFACGITLYRLVNGDRYLPQLNIDKVREGILKGTFPDRELYREFIPKALCKVINKSMSVKPRERYDTAENLRHALEQIPIQANWNEQSTPNSIRWSFGKGKENECIEVHRNKLPSGNFEVVTKKGHSKHDLRRITKLCLYNTTEAKAIKFSQDILQKFVLGKI